MAQYKVPQDVEAEDHIIGPLTLKQFIYAIIAVAWAGLCYVLFKNVLFLLILFVLPVSSIFLLLAFYRRDGQNFEQLLIALTSFFANSRVRIWRKEAVIESFHVEPTKIQAEITQRNPADVRAELSRLATLVDSRGLNQPQPASQLIMPGSSLVAPAPIIPEEAATDIFDLHDSPLGVNLNALIEQAAADVRKEAMDQMRAVPTASTQKSTSGNVTPAPSSDILKLANESDLTVSQLAAQATRLAPIAEGQSVDLRNNAKPNP